MSLSLVFLFLTLGSIIIIIIFLIEDVVNKKILFEVIILFFNASFSILFD